MIGGARPSTIFYPINFSGKDAKEIHDADYPVFSFS